MNKKKQNNILHLLGSLAFLSLPIFFSPDLHLGKDLFFVPPFLESFFRQFLLLGYFYLNYYFLLPTLYYNRKKIVFLCLTIVLFAIIIQFPKIIFPFDYGEFRPHKPPHQGFPIHKKPNFLFPIFNSGIVQFLFVFMFSYILKSNKRIERIIEEKQLAEIAYLKAQINPHFLFNTLNSLYALTLTKSNDAPNAVLKLSELMRYVVTESAQDIVPLEKELKYLQNYIELQQLRIEDTVTFSFTVVGNPLGKNIAPLLLIPFIENAFKYGINPEKESEISISIEITATTLFLNVWNKMVVEEVSEELKTEKGIENTLKRLEYMYPDKHRIDIKKDTEKYHIQLEITLA